MPPSPAHSTELDLPFTPAEVEGSIPDRFRRVAAHFPDQLAIHCGAAAYTYRELDQLTDRAAAALRPFVNAPGQPVALLFAPGQAGSLLGLLSVLKAGGCYVGLSPAFPLERKQAICDDAQAVVILTDQEHAAMAGEFAPASARVVVLEQALAADRPAAAPAAIEAGQAAALFFTSGSSGRPKGIIRTQRQALHRARLNGRNLSYGPGDRALLTNFIGYAASTGDVFGALLNGATLYPLDLQQHTVPDLLDFLRREAITIFAPPVAMFRQMLAELSGPVNLPALRLLGMGGDALLKQTVETFRRHFGPDCTLVYRFSMSETSMVTQLILRPGQPLPERLSVGHPVEDCEVLIWDDNRAAVPAGEVGQIAVRSRFIAPGYWRNPELTAQTFLPDPQGGDQRIFLSGDMGRILPDGALEYFGRSDQQVKIRGYRVELMEVELALQALDPALGVAQAVVVAHQRDGGERELVAFVVPAAGGVLAVAPVRAALAAALPDYMVPARIVPLSEMPLTPSSKPDRQALSRRELPPISEDGFVAARDDLERQLAGLWEAVLKVQPVGARDNFFELGGNSLSAIALMTRLAKTTGHKLPLTALFQAPTVEQLAALLRSTNGQGASLPASPLVPLQPLGARAPLFLIPELETSALHLGRLVRYLGSGRPIYGLHPRGFEDGQPPHTSIAAIARYYLDAIQAVRPHGPYLLAGICYGGLVAYEMAQQLRQRGEAVPLLALVDVSSVAPRQAPVADRALSWFSANRQHWQRWRGYASERLRPLLRRWGAKPSATADETEPRATRRLRYAQRIAGLHYRAQTYPGPVALIQSDEFHQRGCQDDWSRLATAGLPVEVLAGTTHTQLLTEEAMLRRTAEWITAQLEHTTLGTG